MHDENLPLCFLIEVDKILRCFSGFIHNCVIWRMGLTACLKCSFSTETHFSVFIARISVLTYSLCYSMLTRELQASHSAVMEIISLFSLPFP